MIRRAFVTTFALLAGLSAGSPAAPGARAQSAPPAAPPLVVVRAAPRDTAGPGSSVTFTLDRPVRASAGAGAGGDASALARLVRVEPAVRVVVRWADPVTLRVTPLEPLAPGRRYTVTLAPGLEAADGGRLVGPARVAFTVRAAAVVASEPGLQPGWPATLPVGAQVRLLVDGPADLARLARGARLDFAAAQSPTYQRLWARGPGAPRDSARCAALRPVAFRAAERPVRAGDPYPFDPPGAGRYRYRPAPVDPVADPRRFRRVVTLTPAAPVAEGCAAVLVLPGADPRPGSAAADAVRYPVRTAPPFALAGVRPDDELGDSATLALTFTAPVRRADVLRHVRLEPARPFTLAGDDDAAPQPFWALRTSLAPRTRHRVLLAPALRDTAGRSIAGPRAVVLDVGGRTPRVGHDVGLVTVPPAAPGLPARQTLRVRHVNVEAAELTVWAVPDSLRGRVLAFGAPNATVLAQAGLGEGTRTVVPLAAPRDSERVTVVPVPAPPGAPAGALLAVRVTVARARAEPADTAPTRPPGSRVLSTPATWTEDPANRPLALVQAGDLALHVKAAPGDGGLAFVTRLSTGAPVAGARVTVFDTSGMASATGTTAADGVAQLVPALPAAEPDTGRPPNGREADPAFARGPRYVGVYRPPAAPLAEAAFGGERVVEGAGGAGTMGWYGASLAPERLGGQTGAGPRPRATLVTDRDLFRPGETVHLAAVVRDGVLGALRTPAGDWVRLRVTGQPGYDGEPPALRDTVLRLDAFGTAVDSVVFGAALPLGFYRADVARWRGGAWQPLAATTVRLAEYRAPEFRVTLVADSAPRYAGDTVRARVGGRLLYDAPMAGAAVHWRAVLQRGAGAAALPGLDARWTVGDAEDAWPGTVPRPPGPPGTDVHEGDLTLDARGEAELAVPTGSGPLARPGRLEVEVAVTDVNRQTVARAAAVTLHPAAVYLAARDSADAGVWAAGVPRTVRVLALTPEGRRLTGVRVRVAVAALRWVPDGGRGPWGGRWAADTVARDSLVTGALGDTARLRVAPPARGGMAAVVLTARDSAGREARTVLRAYVAGGRDLAWWGPDRAPAHLAVLPVRSRAAPGDTAEVRFASPFDSAEAWVTVERERVLRAWRLQVPAGPGVARVPISAQDAPNVFVGVLLVRRGPARAGEPVQERLRAGYAPVEVDRTAQRLLVELRDARQNGTGRDGAGRDGAGRDTAAALRYAPGDTARLRLRVRDAEGRPAAATVALWAVDEGVLALTGQGRPSVLDALYQPDGLGAALGSTLARLGDARPPWLGGGPGIQVRGISVAGGTARGDPAVYFEYSGAGDSAAPAAAPAPPPPPPPPPPPAPMEAPPPPAPDGPAVRSRFRTTAFYLGAVRTDARGEAAASPVLPDNLTTFRVTALAVAAGDAYGDADAPLVATKPLVVRGALPRFVRVGDQLTAGGVVALADSAAPPTAVRVRADVRGDARGLVRVDSAEQAGVLAGGAGAERRWRWRVPADADTGTARVRLTAVAGPLGDAVEVALPVRPAAVPRAHVAVGTVAGAADTVRLALPATLDPARSRLVLRAGPSPLPAVRAAWAGLAAYPYAGSEQLASAGRALVALLRLRTAGAPAAPGERADAADLARRLQAVADSLAARQRYDGAIGYWERGSWSTAWLSAEVGLVLLDARALGARVEPLVVQRLARYLGDSARAGAAAPPVPADAFGTRADRRRLGARVLAGRLAAADFLRRAGVPNAAAEQALAGAAAAMAWEDRARLAAVLAAAGDSAGGGALVDALWATVGRGGARADLPDSLLETAADFPSHVRAPARLLLATLALRPAHPRVGELVERLVQRERAEAGGWRWNTQDLAASAAALGELARRGGWAPARLRVRAADGRVLLAADARGAGDASGAPEAPGALGTAGVPLAGLVAREGDRLVLPLRVEREGAPARPGGVGAFYAVTVHEVPLPDTAGAPAPPRDDQGLAVTRWYERLADGTPALAVAGGELVRVRLHVTAPADREFVAVEDLLPAGLEVVDLAFRTSPTLGPGARPLGADGGDGAGPAPWWRWQPWEHSEQRDDAVRWFARRLLAGTYALSYVARATTAGRFARPPAHAEEMYNPALAGRTEGGRFVVGDGGAAQPAPATLPP